VRITRSGELLRSLLEGGELSVAQVAAALCVTTRDCDEFVEGVTVMSAVHQLSFATLLIERVPRLARRGYALRAQVVATAAFSDGVTEVHSSSPAKWSASRMGGGR
jgi:hypothetical protein